MEKNGEENIDLHLERLTIATVSCVRSFPQNYTKLMERVLAYINVSFNS
jgi:hypothetical protein